MYYLDVLARDAGYASYDTYLRSRHWTTMKQKYRKSACYCCQSHHQLHLHHTTYERMGRELPHDLVTVCEPCHVKIHQYVAEHPKSLYQAHVIIKSRTKPTSQRRIPSNKEIRQDPFYQEHVIHWSKLSKRRLGKPGVERVKDTLLKNGLLVDAGNEDLEPSEKAYITRVVVVGRDGNVYWNRKRATKVLHAHQDLIRATIRNRQISDSLYAKAMTTPEKIGEIVQEIRSRKAERRHQRALAKAHP